MASGRVVVDGHNYSLRGGILQAFGYQLDATDWADAEMENDNETAEYVTRKRDAFLAALPPRGRWLLIHACLQMAAHAALVQESKKR